MDRFDRCRKFWSLLILMAKFLFWKSMILRQYFNYKYFLHKFYNYKILVILRVYVSLEMFFSMQWSIYYVDEMHSASTMRARVPFAGAAFRIVTLPTSSVGRRASTVDAIRFWRWLNRGAALRYFGVASERRGNAFAYLLSHHNSLSDDVINYSLLCGYIMRCLTCDSR